MTTRGRAALIVCLATLVACAKQDNADKDKDKDEARSAVAELTYSNAEQVGKATLTTKVELKLS
jgi:hypothetical protein